jgi:hypothetical protein
MLKVRLNKLGRESINGLIKKNITLTADDIVTIHELSKRATSGLLDSRLLLMASKKVGNINIYPLTIGARVWLQTMIKDYFESDPIYYGLALLYAHAFARSPEKLNFDDPEKIKVDIMNWAKIANVTESEFNEVVESLSHNVPKDEILEILLDITQQIKRNPNTLNLKNVYELYDRIEYENEHKEDVIPAVAILMKQYGQTLEHWLWKESEETCVALIRQAIEMETGKKTNFGDPALVAFTELQQYIQNLK